MLLMYLVLEKRRRPELLEEACRPVEGIHPDLAIKDLVEERRIDLEREEGKAQGRGASQR
jgi:hypothetical protein